MEKRILGKGLAALIAQNAIQLDAEIATINNNGSEIEINKIIANPEQPRRVFSENELLELAESIKEHGILQPILLKELENGLYEIIAGERRWQAAKKACLEKVPAIVKQVTSKESLELAIIENIQRQDLTTIEEAQGFHKLIDSFNYTHEQLAKRIGKSRSYISNMLRMLNLPDDVKELLNNKQISSGHARVLLTAKNPKHLAEEIISKGLSVRQTEDLAKHDKRSFPSNLKTIKNPKFTTLVHDKADKDEDIIAIEKMLTEQLKLKVQIVDTKDGGQLQIDFKTLQELDKLIQAIADKGLNF